MTTSPTSKHLDVLSRLLLAQHGPDGSGSEGTLDSILALQDDDLEPVLTLANSHHVVVRALQPFRRVVLAAENLGWADWAAKAVEAEQHRIQSALFSLQAICAAFVADGCDITVIKSLDHWPDLGGDLDLYTNADPADVIGVLTELFQASLEARSWGDRLANKWNFIVPGLRELVEVHVGRLGQTGEHVGFARAIPLRSYPAQVGGQAFSVPCPEHRLIIATLQRMYRHFYLRLCDVVDTATLLETKTINYPFLRTSADQAGIWDGVATFLSIVSDYVQNYRGVGLDLPDFVRSAARLGGDRINFHKGFLRVPIMPESVGLYATELTALMRNGEFRGTLRLSLLPCLATAAALEQKITGSDKGIW